MISQKGPTYDPYRICLCHQKKKKTNLQLLVDSCAKRSLVSKKLVAKCGGETMKLKKPLKLHQADGTLLDTVTDYAWVKIEVEDEIYSIPCLVSNLHQDGLLF
jgi:hypothetical protein